MAKAKKYTARTSNTKGSKPIISPLQIGLVAVAALLIVGGLIVLGNQARGFGGGSVDMSQYPTLGDSDAPVTIVEYSDYG